MLIFISHNLDKTACLLQNFILSLTEPITWAWDKHLAGYVHILCCLILKMKPNFEVTSLRSYKTNICTTQNCGQHTHMT
jgi:hypothetical protein